MGLKKDLYEIHVIFFDFIMHYLFPINNGMVIVSNTSAFRQNSKDENWYLGYVILQHVLYFVALQ